VSVSEGMRLARFHLNLLPCLYRVRLFVNCGDHFSRNHFKPLHLLGMNMGRRPGCGGCQCECHFNPRTISIGCRFQDCERLALFLNSKLLHDASLAAKDYGVSDENATQRESDQLFRIGDIAHGFDCANSNVDLIQKFGRNRGLHFGNCHSAILLGMRQTTSARGGNREQGLSFESLRGGKLFSRHTQPQKIRPKITIDLFSFGAP